MPFVPASTPSLVAFLVLVASILACLLWATFAAKAAEEGTATAYRASFKLAATIVVWQSLLAFPVVTGHMLAFPFPGIPLFFAAANLGGLALAVSPWGGLLARNTPIAYLVAFQSFRLPLELILHQWAREGTIPSTMTWEGQNFDILSGILALLLAPLAGTFRTAAWIANLGGLLLLGNVARVATLSSPLPFAWPVDPPLQLVLYWPYSLIGPVCVAGALAGHIVLTRKLLARQFSN